MERLIRQLILALLLAAPLAAQDETLTPNADSGSTVWGRADGTDCSDQTFCNTGACELDVDEDPASADNNINAPSTNNSINAYGFTDPAEDLSTATDAHTVDVTVTRVTSSCVENASGSNPSFDLILFCNGVNKGDIASDVSITGLDQNNQYTFTYTPDGDCDAAGTNLQIGIRTQQAGGGGNRRHAGVEAVWIDVTYAAAARGAIITERLSGERWYYAVK